MKSMLKSLMSVAVAALAFTSCSNDATEDVMPNVGTKTLEVTATIDQTRTTLDGTHTNLTWATDDQIHLYIGANATTVNSIDPVNGGKITGVTYDETTDKVYAYYSLPYEGLSSTGAKNALININQKQTQTDPSVFAGKNLPMVASSSIVNGQAKLVFKPVGCVLVFNVYGQTKTAGEKIKSIKFETSKGCYGYDYCDLTAENLVYEAYSGGKNATVTLTNYATVGAEKPSDTKKGENQVYLVVAPDEYPAGSTFTVTTDATKNNTYTFTTKTALDCKTNNARVVNLNLTKSAELKQEIIVPTHVDEQSSEAKNGLLIEGIQFKNLSAEQIGNARISIYNDTALDQPVGEGFWLTISNQTVLSEGRLYCDLAANPNAESRTAYIVIECGDVKSSAIAITQVGAGSEPANSVVTTFTPSSSTTTGATLDNGAVTLAFEKNNGTTPAYNTNDPSLRCYAKNKIIVKSTTKILKIEIVRASSTSNTLSANVGTMSGDTWMGESNEVEMIVSGTSGHIKVASMTITYVESNEPKIIVPTVEEKQPAGGSTLKIENIAFKNIDLAKVTTGVYSDPELTKQENVDWLTISNPAATLADGVLNCEVAANTGAERTAYIGIKYSETVKAAIAITQLAKGAVQKYFVKVTSNLEDWTGDYLIVYEDGKQAFNGKLTTNFNKANSSEVKITEERILLDNDTKDLLVKISKKEGATGEYMYMLQTASGYYLYSQGNSTTMNGTNDLNTAAQYPHSINISNGSAIIKSSAESNRYWQYNSTYFRYYTSNYQSIQLYKLQE